MNEQGAGRPFVFEFHCLCVWPLKRLLAPFPLPTRPTLPQTQKHKTRTLHYTDPATDRAASLLRLLHVADLRRLQSAVDGATVAVQELTANPRTDAALGKVGR